MSGSRIRSWEAPFSDEELAIFKAAGYGRRILLGQRPAVLLVDATRNFTGDRPESILESIKRFPDSCGEHAWDSMPAISKLLEKVRDAGLPLIYTRGPFQKNAVTLGGWKRSRGRTEGMEDDIFGESFVDQITPMPNDIVIEKTRPSAFFGTPLVSILRELDVDTLLVGGATTSGCVRATVVDAFSLGFRVAVVEDTTFDRSQLSRAVNLFDMHNKYAEVVSLDSALRYIRRLVRRPQIAPLT
jgi:maleamate amidohydrolase